MDTLILRTVETIHQSLVLCIREDEKDTAMQTRDSVSALLGCHLDCVLER